MVGKEEGEGLFRFILFVNLQKTIRNGATAPAPRPPPHQYLPKFFVNINGIHGETEIVKSVATILPGVLGILKSDNEVAGLGIYRMASGEISPDSLVPGWESRRGI
jgi:hypothetical protein